MVNIKILTKVTAITVHTIKRKLWRYRISDSASPTMHTMAVLFKFQKFTRNNWLGAPQTLRPALRNIEHPIDSDQSRRRRREISLQQDNKVRQSHFRLSVRTNCRQAAPGAQNTLNWSRAGRRMTASMNEPLEATYLFQKLSPTPQRGNAVAFRNTYHETSIFTPSGPSLLVLPHLNN